MSIFRKRSNRLGNFLPFSESMVKELASGLAARECRAVVCDISPLGIAVAKAAGVPSILVENFTWDWLYSPYRESYPAFDPIIEMMAAWFSAADIHAQTEPVCRLLPEASPFHPVSRRPKRGAKAVREALGVSDSKPLVLISMGGVTTRYRFTELLEKMPRVVFVLPNDVPRASRKGDIISLPHHSAFYHPDLVNAADLVIGKIGYSTLAEVGHAGKPFGYINRKESVESLVLVNYAERHVKGRAISEANFASGRWIEMLDSLLELKSSVPAFPDDADRMAMLVLETASEMTAIASTPPFQGFDPFNDRMSRDTRNRLSEAFVSALGRLDLEPVRQEADALKGLSIPKSCADYIRNRVRRYGQILDQAAAGQIRDPKQQVLLVWNAGLFFECHELLETLWLNTDGAERKALQGLIQSAGVFVHRELGRKTPAEKLSPKAVNLLERYRSQLYFIANLEDLISALKKNGAGAPKLKRR